MGPIFNKSRVKKEVCGSCKLCIGPTGKPPQPQEVRNALPKKKKKHRRGKSRIQTVT